MVARGGGVVEMTVRKLPRSKPKPGISYWLVIHLHIDTCDSMGANCASTVAETIAHYLGDLCNARVGLRIVSNLCTDRISTAKFSIPVSKLDYKGFDGREVAERICEAYQWAEDDPYRAVTHNKGIMNGIDAVAIATGQDWRALEASSHAWASMKQKSSYRPLTSYEIETNEDGVEVLVGILSLPLSTGSKGGVLRTNPLYNYTMGLMGNPDSKNLAMVSNINKNMVCVGLAQNFAALRALATEGIQRGHMSLHARNIAVSGIFD